MCTCVPSTFKCPRLRGCKYPFCSTLPGRTRNFRTRISLARVPAQHSHASTPSIICSARARFDCLPAPNRSRFLSARSKIRKRLDRRNSLLCQIAGQLRFQLLRDQLVERSPQVATLRWALLSSPALLLAPATTALL